MFKIIFKKMLIMKRQTFLHFLFFLFILSGCKKENIATSIIKVSNPFFDSSVAFLRTTLSNGNFERLDISNFEQLQYNGKILGVKIFEKNIPHDRFLILGNASGDYEGNWVDMSDLKNTQSTRYQSGSISLTSLDGKFITKVVVEKSKVVNIIKQPDKNPALDNVSPILPEIIIFYDVNNGGDNGGGSSFTSLYWLFNQNAFYSGYYYQDPGSSGSGTGHGAGSTPGNKGDNISAAPTFISPDKPISDVKKEVECFTNNSTSTYSISVNVNQPIPNSRDIMNVFAAFQVGHSFLTFNQINADGTQTIRNIGFYPKNEVKPANIVDQSTFGEDSNTPFDVSLKFEVSGTEFINVINTLVGQQSASYDLDNFNCTNSLMSALGSININLPSTKSTDLLFNGNNPADLGEDIRNLNLDDFSTANGNRKITRSVSNSNDQKPPAKKGSC